MQQGLRANLICLTQFVFEPDRNNGSYEIPSEPPGPDNAQGDETLVINPKLGVITKDVDDEVTTR